jgi:phenylacetic acid degradation operon negative regulatory protein
MHKNRNDLGRPLTARNVVASTLLGMQPPELAGQVLVRSGELFGISEGTTRVALSRMVADGELETGDGRYWLAGRLLDRQARQAESRAPRLAPWDGTWRMAVVTAGGRTAPERAQLRAVLARLRLAEWREGVWLRPANVARAPDPVADAQCEWVEARLPGTDEAALARRLWDLDNWAARARLLRQRMAETEDGLRRRDTAVLATTFVVAAAVLRHLQADPLLPTELLPRDWPGQALRADYDAYEAAFQATWRAWYRQSAPSTAP